MMDKIKRYINVNVPITYCNLRCPYCYIGQMEQFRGKPPVFNYAPEHIGRALSKERLGGTCLLNFCGEGETLIPREVAPIVRALLENGHYVHVVTNGTLTKRIEEMLNFPAALLDRLMFKLSLHYLEFKRLAMLDSWFDTVNSIRKTGASITIEITPHDELIPYIDEIKQTCAEKAGAWPHISIARNQRVKGLPVLSSLGFKDYVNTWKVFDSEFFNFKASAWGVRRREFCYGGSWFLNLDIGSGALSQCYWSIYSQNIFKDLSRPIHFWPIGHHCLMPHCYNSQVLTLGVIPDLPSPTYAAARDRECSDGTRWLTDTMRVFMNSKLRESNALVNPREQKKYGALMLLLRVAGIGGRGMRLVKKIMRALAGKTMERNKMNLPPPPV
jgi:organic radical activating enzyme